MGGYIEIVAIGDYDTTTIISYRRF